MRVGFPNIYVMLGLGRHASLALGGILPRMRLGFVHAFVADAVGRRHAASENVVLKVAFLLGAVREDHSAPAVLDSAFPLTHVGGAIDPGHLAEAFALILVELALVDVPRFAPGKGPITVFDIVYVLALIDISLWIILLSEPLAWPVPHAPFELAFIERSINRYILAVSIELPIQVVTDVDIPIGEQLTAPSMLEAALPFSFVAVSVLMDINSVPFTL